MTEIRPDRCIRSRPHRSVTCGFFCPGSRTASACRPDHVAQRIIENLLQSTGLSECSGALLHRLGVRIHRIRAKRVGIPQTQELRAGTAMQQIYVAEVSRVIWSPTGGCPTPCRVLSSPIAPAAPLQPPPELSAGKQEPVNDLVESTAHMTECAAHLQQLRADIRRRIIRSSAFSGIVSSRARATDLVFWVRRVGASLDVRL